MNDKELNLRIEKLVGFTCDYFGVTESQIYGRGRDMKLTEARNMLWFALHYELKVSSTQIAKDFFRLRRWICRSIASTKLRMKTCKSFLWSYNEYLNEYKKATTK